MSSDDQHFLDMLSSIPNDVKKYSLEVADAIDRQIDTVAALLRDSLSHQSWLPPSVRPPPPPPPLYTSPAPPATFFERAQDWVSTHRAWAAAIIAFVGTGGFLIYRQRRLYCKRRRARKATNGARKEIIVIASSPHEPMARSIALDLERRGFIVFFTVTSPEEEQLVQTEAKADIRSLFVDVTSSPPSPSDLHPSLNQVYALLNQPQYPAPGAPAHICHLSGLILIPSPTYPTGPLATIAPSTWADTLNTRLLTPVLTTQLFLPLLSSSRNNSRSTIVLLTPAISSPLAAPFNSPEVLVTRALEGWASSLRRELHLSAKRNQTGPIDVVQLKLGNIDLGPSIINRSTSTEVLTWQPSLRSQIGPGLPYASLAQEGPKGSPPRVLHNAIFDAVAMNTNSGRTWRRKRNVMYVGRGSLAYSVIGNWAPGRLVAWMLGFGVGPGVWKTSEDLSSGSEIWEKV